MLSGARPARPAVTKFCDGWDIEVDFGFQVAQLMAAVAVSNAFSFAEAGIFNRGGRVKKVMIDRRSLQLLQGFAGSSS